MSDQLPSQNWKWSPLVAVLGAFVLALGLFLMIPLTQLLEPIAKPDVVVRPIQITELPPPPQAPPPPEEPPPPDPQTVLPEPAAEPPSIEVQALDIALSPGAGDALAMGAPAASFESKIDATEAIERLFSFEDLTEAPRLISTPTFRFPSSLARRGVETGQVIVEIDILVNGRARLHRIVSSTHRELEPVAREIIKQARFTEPLVNGRPQTVRGRFPLILKN